ncbi:site-specific integrase [Burkholderia gladioli]|uniref:site-specific integrase n=1 Tax=Burkholderia gladioli TaxID=28095 RepID=UPI001640FC23|nr:site-specific integrase [Burkholderia gladioli]
MATVANAPSQSEIEVGHATFRDDLPVWFGHFGDDSWSCREKSSPDYLGDIAMSIMWSDFYEGRGPRARSIAHLTNRDFCLTFEIVHDFKIAAYIHGHFPILISGARRKLEKLDPVTVRGRILELAHFFSLVMMNAELRGHPPITRLGDISLQLVIDTIYEYPGRAEHLRRALRLISDPVVQKNLSAPLQWTLVDIDKTSIKWAKSEPRDGAGPLTDAQFLFLLNHSIAAIAQFKKLAAIEIHDIECRAVANKAKGPLCPPNSIDLSPSLNNATDADFHEKFGVPKFDAKFIIAEAHTSAMLVILLLSGMRISASRRLVRGCLVEEQGYWFLKSNEVKQKPKDAPAAEGWLAIDITRDAYDVLMFTSERTGNNYLFSTPHTNQNRTNASYRSGTLDMKYNRWIQLIDEQRLFEGFSFGVHQCRETLVAQLANQGVRLPFISMQLKHFHSQFHLMPNPVTAGYGNYRRELMTSVTNRLAQANENALSDVYGEHAKFAGGGAAAHKARIDTFFSGMGLFGKDRELYISDMARRGINIMSTSIGVCTQNFLVPREDKPPCYGDFSCQPSCSSHVMTQRAATVLRGRRAHAAAQADQEKHPGFKVIYLGLVKELDAHIDSLKDENEGLPNE